MDNYNIETYDKYCITDIVKIQIYRLLQFSEYDFSEYIGTDLNVYGEFEYEHYEDYFINNISYQLNNDNTLCVAEFFIMKKYRKKGYGRILAKYIFDTLNGKWEVFQMKNNTIAGVFWDNIIKDYTKDNYKVIELENEDGNIGNVFLFEN